MHVTTAVDEKQNIDGLARDTVNHAVRSEKDLANLLNPGGQQLLGISTPLWR
jgi:hypothetical protein